MLEDYKAINENVTVQLHTDNYRLTENIKALESRLANNEQRSRNECLLIHGVSENEVENTDDLALEFIKNELGLVDFSMDKLQRSHRFLRS